MHIGTGYQDQSIVICAFRYALGRQTYMVSLVADWLKEHWGQIDSIGKELIIKETEEALQKGWAGSKMDEDTWRMFLEKVKEC